MIEVYSAEKYPQGSEEWFALRKGIPTASEFAKVMAKAGPRGGTSHREYIQRTKYLRELAGEIVTGEPKDSWNGNLHTERGKEREDEARAMYGVMNDVNPIQVGFVKNGAIGCSPDSFIGEEGGLEIKDAIPSVQIERLQAGALPQEYRWQVIGSLLVTQREWWDFMSHSRGLPPLIIRVHRNYVQTDLDDLAEGLDRFIAERDALVKWLEELW